MTILEQALKELKDLVIELGQEVYGQVQRAHQALLTFDKKLALIVNEREKRVDALELQVDRECENILALYSPVATDLRLVLASLKINIYLERAGDNANSIAKYILQSEQPFPQELLTTLRIPEAFETAERMLSLALQAYESEQTDVAGEVFHLDTTVNEINKYAAARLEELVRKDVDRYLHAGLYALSTVRKLERIGDLSKNIIEEVVFYVEAKVLRHKKKLQSQLWQEKLKGNS